VFSEVVLSSEVIAENMSSLDEEPPKTHEIIVKQTSSESTTSICLIGFLID